MFRFSKYYVLFIGLLAVWFGLVKCANTESNATTESESSDLVYLNHHDSAQYVGMEACKSCHAEIYETFKHTGMGRSFGDATTTKSAAVFDKHSLIYDAENNLYYRAFFRDSVLYIHEYRLIGRDTVHSRVEKVDYIIGSGQHTNSHIMQINGYLYQMPMTFYTQSKKWDLPPGYTGNNTRFSRAIETECLTCHNAYPSLVENADHKYHALPKGIDCERCHGPGSIHVNQKIAGNRVDTSKTPDLSIVNPRRLSFDLQVAICSRCHLQGNTVLKENKTFFDFKPGMQLSEIMSVFLPRYANADKDFIMASHADRMALSACFVKSNGQMSCITCHNPHKSIEITPTDHYNKSCISCHSNKINCSQSLEVLSANNNNCVSCHMHSSSATDIPHVSITDHWITKTPKRDTMGGAKKTFIRLKSINEEMPSALISARAYLQYFERFENEFFLLDSAKLFLDLVKTPSKSYFEALINYKYLKNDWQGLISIVNNNISFAADFDGWTYYRIGEAFLNAQQFNLALQYLQKAVQAKPFQLDFRLKFAAAFTKNNNNLAAKAEYQKVLSENPKLAKAHNNLGYLFLLEGNIKAAENHYQTAINLDPDYEAAWLNKVGLLIYQTKQKEAIDLLRKLKKRFPQNARFDEILLSLNANSRG